METSWRSHWSTYGYGSRNVLSDGNRYPIFSEVLQISKILECVPMLYVFLVADAGPNLIRLNLGFSTAVDLDTQLANREIVG